METTHILDDHGRPYCGSKQHPLIHGGLNVATCDTCVTLAAADAGVSRCRQCGWFHDHRNAWWFHGPGALPRESGYSLPQKPEAPPDGEPPTE